MGAVDFGWALRAYVTLTNSAREGARLGVTLPTDSADMATLEANNIALIQQRAVDYSDGVIASTADVDVEYPDGLEGENPVRVTAHHDYAYITPLGGLLSVILPDPLPMSSTSEMRIETDR
jgi:hypothetical protein